MDATAAGKAQSERNEAMSYRFGHLMHRYVVTAIAFGENPTLEGLEEFTVAGGIPTEKWKQSDTFVDSGVVKECGPAHRDVGHLC